MKLLHTSDWHLGKMIYGRSLLPDQEYFIRGVLLPLLRKERPDLLLISGDVYDRQVAPAEAIRLFDFFLAQAHALNIPVAVLAGNHDGADRMAIGAPLLRREGICIVSSLKEAMQPLDLGGEADLYLLPYFDPAQARAFLQNDALRGFQEAYTAVLDKLKETFRTGRVHFLAAHCFVMGSAVSASESPTFVGGSAEVSASLFKEFAYVALGHLHGPQRAGENGRYSGSPLKYSFDEADQKKSLTMVSYEGDAVSTVQIPVTPMRDLRVLRGTFDELYDGARAHPSEDYLYLNLTDEAPVYMPMDRMRPYYPNLLGLCSEWLTRAGEGENGALREQLGKRRADDKTIDDVVILEEFLRQICGTQATPQDRPLFLEALNGEGEDTP